MTIGMMPSSESPPIARPGVSFSTSRISSSPFSEIVALVTAVTAIGVSWRLVSRRCAVTVISWI
jgi:hypothetical protein